MSGDRNSRVRTPTGLSIPILRRTSINTYTATQRPPELSRTSPSPTPSRIVIPPITVSNPTETYAIVERMNAAKTTPKTPEKEATPEKKSMMRELFSFVKKPKSMGSSSSSTTTSRNRFASAFSRATISSSGSVSSSGGSPSLVRQCTYSSGTGAIPKQMSESSSGFEPRLSFKFAKMSLRLRNRFSSERKKTTTITVQQAQQQQQQNSQQVCSSYKQSDRSNNTSRGDNNNVDNTNTDAVPFELANVHFEKVGESYIKHDKSKRYNNDNHNNNNTNTNNHTNNNSNVDVADRLSALSNENAQLLDAILGASTSTGSLVKRCESREPVEPRISEECEEAVAEAEKQSNEKFIPDSLRDEIERLIKPIKLEPVYVNIVELRNEINNNKKEDEDEIFHKPLNCPTIEFEPPSRRSSFDPPRSPYLENLRSSCGSTGASTDTDLLIMSRLNSGEDSFEMMESERRRESSFEGPVSTYTSYDMSRYQSTSCEDPGSSFEIVDMDQTHIEMRKSSIEFVDSITLQRTDSKRKMSLETHFDYNPSLSPNASQATSAYVSDTHSCTTPRQRSPAFPIGRKHRNSTLGLIGAPRSPLSAQTSSNYSSRDSYDSSSSHVPLLEPKDCHLEFKPIESLKKHFPFTIKSKGEEIAKSFVCTDKRCENIFEPRPQTKTVNSGIDSGMSVLSSSGEFDPPSPRRCSSVSPKHMFMFKIVMKKVDSMPHEAAGSRKNSENLGVSNERRRSRTLEKLRRRDSRKKRF